jgi:hypothetical protein
MPYFFVVLVVFFLVMAASIGWIMALAIIAGCFIASCIAATFLYYRRSPSLTRMKMVYSLGRSKTFRKCTYCSGGVQILYHRNGHDEAMTWGPIPPEWNMVQKDGEGWGTIEPPVANKRTCPECLGKGAHIMVRGDISLPPPLTRKRR